MLRFACFTTASHILLAVVVWLAAQRQNQPGWLDEDGSSNSLSRRLGLPGERNPAHFCAEVHTSGLVCEEKGATCQNNGNLHGYKAGQHDKLLVKTGKTGSTTVTSLMEKAGLQIQTRTPAKMKFFGSQHMHALRRDQLFGRDDIGVTVRDPIERTLSAIAFLLEVEGRRGRQKAFFKCFDSAEKFALALDQDTVCGLKARASLYDVDVDRRHINRGYCFHMGGLMNTLAGLQTRGKARVHIIRLEHHLEDVNRMLRVLGYKELPESAAHVHAHNNTETKERYNVDLSPTARAILKKHLDAEYYIYERLLQMNGLDP